ncbi:hypothetical protein [Mucilaginibacter sp. PAMB04168]|uniref:DUF7009 family protein n=1 Tax=Mucilaginibacter sp. PAMB04168 TaxID=3138567 RepID=UPI0031F70AB6
MEITISETVLNYNLSKAEFDAFAHEGVCKQRIVIGEEPILFVLQRTAENEMRATLHTNLVTVFVPENIADEWTAGENSFLETQDGSLHITIKAVDGSE